MGIAVILIVGLVVWMFLEAFKDRFLDEGDKNE
jgi:hypothetical protein